MNLLDLREGFVTTVEAAFVGSTPPVTVDTHGGEYSLDAIRRYAQKAPAVIVSVLSVDSDKAQLETQATGTVHMAAFVMDRSHAGNPRGDSALDLVTRLLRVITTSGQFWGLDGCLAAPSNIKARNLYAPDLDGVGIALWSVTWGQLVDLTDDELDQDELLHLHADYDLGPTPDGVVEATDNIMIGASDPDHVLSRADEVIAGRSKVVSG